MPQTIEKDAFGQTLARPESTEPVKIFWSHAISVSAVHLLALLALLPWCFSWSGVLTCFLGLYVFGTLGINLGYHRLLTHRGLVVPKWLEHGLAMLGMCCLEDTPARWVAVHRMHHQHSDEQEDPHSPLVSVAWGHVGWLFVQSRDHYGLGKFERYSRDLLRDPFYFRLERGMRSMSLVVYVAHALVFFLAGFAIQSLRTGDVSQGLRFGVSLLVWGVFLRTVLVWHITWSVNSLSHVWGYRNYETRDRSRNNWFVALISNGEGWHNNHHWDQRCAAHGHRWWEFDVTYISIRLLECVGLATQVAHPGRDRSQGEDVRKET